MSDSFWLSVAIGGTIGALIAIYFLVLKGKNFSSPQMSELKRIRELLCQSYPSDISFRCFPRQAIGALSEDTLIYLVAEGNNVILVLDEDMQPKFQIPIDSIKNFSAYNTTIRVPVANPAPNTPNYTLQQAGAITLEYTNDEGLNTKLDFIMGEDYLSKKYNLHSLGSKRDPRIYINARINERKAAGNS